MGSLHMNRELSWLEFNTRVLRLAEETSIPLLERLKFVAIFSSNLDEFFQVRVGALHDRQEAGSSWRSFDGMTAPETLDSIRTKVIELCLHRDRILDDLLGELSRRGVALCTPGELDRAEQQYIDEWFAQRILPMLTPLAVDPAHPFPYISNLALSIGVMVRDPETLEERFARVKVPGTERFVHVGNGRYVPIEEVITGRIHLLFPGMEVSRAHVFRVTRNTDLDIDAEEAEDLLEAVELELRKRRFGNAVRLEVVNGIDRRVLDLLLEELELDPIDVYHHDRFVSGSEFWELHRIDRPDLRDEEWRSVTAGRLWAAEARGESFFSVIRHRALMVHHPYESFSTSTDEFIRQAAEDPRVRAIKATLYRTSSDSPIARNLIAAAERGVQVVALVELTARFDEQTNVRWAKELERAGAHVVYGMVGLKTHAKCILVVREEESGLRRYAHIGTGNYNSSTARVYEDIGIFTCDEDITDDVANLFNHLTGFSRSPSFRELVTAPHDLRRTIVSLIRNEAELGELGRISLKVNSLVDDEIIRELHAAAGKGVRIDVLVRGICSMSASSVDGLNVRFRSVLGRFLEHSRIYRFAHGTGDGPAYFIGSADMMTRNLDLRVEVLVPVHHPKHRAWLDNVLDTMWSDDVVCFELDGTDRWVRRGPDAFTLQHDAQGLLMQWATDLQLSHGAVSPYDLDDDTGPGGILRPVGRAISRFLQGGRPV
ncbi:MAG: polyphosphate kinase 1 [Ilumatobacteraceae bacterium]